MEMGLGAVGEKAQAMAVVNRVVAAWEAAMKAVGAKVVAVRVAAESAAARGVEATGMGTMVGVTMVVMGSVEVDMAEEAEAVRLVEVVKEVGGREWAKVEAVVMEVVVKGEVTKAAAGWTGVVVLGEEERALVA